jgi:Ca2+-binding RTX toxin-like protein
VKYLVSLIAAAALALVPAASADHVYTIHLTTGHDAWNIGNQQSRAYHIYAYGGDDYVAIAGSGSYNDQIEGMYGDDDMWGGGGNDVLIGGIGRDFLSGGPGFDTCIGNSGADTYQGCEDIS